MKITAEMIKEWNACSGGYTWFTEQFPDGGEYQAVLDRCASEERPLYAHWLMDHAGSDDSVVEVEAIDAKHLFVAGSLICTGACTVKGSLRAGHGIEAGHGIKAGCGYGIFAGLSVRLADWAEYAKVQANERPQNLVSGAWVEGK